MTKININISLQNLQYFIPSASNLDLPSGFKGLQILGQLLCMSIATGGDYKSALFDLRALELIRDYGTASEVGLIVVVDFRELAVRVVDFRIVAELRVE